MFKGIGRQQYQIGRYKHRIMLDKFFDIYIPDPDDKDDADEFDIG